MSRFPCVIYLVQCALVGTLHVRSSGEKLRKQQHAKGTIIYESAHQYMGSWESLGAGLEPDTEQLLRDSSPINLTIAGVELEQPGNETSKFDTVHEVLPKRTLILVYCISLVGVGMLVALMYWPLGLGVVLKIVGYIAALAIVKLAVKTVFETHHFRFPKFITCVHMLASSLAGFLVLHIRKGEGESITKPTLRELVFWISPISLAFAFSIVTENSALVFVSSAFSEVAGSCSPVVSALLTPVLGMPFHPQLLVPIAIVVAGCVVSASGELNFSMIGFMLLLIAMFCRSIKAVTQQKLMTSETKTKFDPAALMAWTCCESFLLLLVYSLIIEGAQPWRAFWQYAHRIELFISILNSCIVAVAVNISGLFCIKHLGAVGMQLVSQTKSVLVIVGGVALLSESFTSREGFGFGAVLVGVFIYSRWKTQLDQESHELVMPKKSGAANFVSEIAPVAGHEQVKSST